MSYQPQQIPSLASEIYIKNVGDTFAASPLATHRGEYRVCERYAQAGFCYYNCVSADFTGEYKRENSIVFRNKDIETRLKTCRFSFVLNGKRVYEVHKYSNSLFDTFETLKEKTLTNCQASAFLIESDQDDESIRKSWNR